MLMPALLVNIRVVLGGAILRDHNGQILCLAWDVIAHCQTAAMGEAIACLEGLKWP